MLAIAFAGRFDAIVVESTGVSLPREVADTFVATVSSPEAEEHAEAAAGAAPVETIENPATASLESIAAALQGKGSLNEIAALDTCVTCVDANMFVQNMGTAAQMCEQFADSVEKTDTRAVGPLLTNQIEFADVIILTKCDLITEEEAAAVEDAVLALNPGTFKNEQDRPIRPEPPQPHKNAIQSKPIQCNR